MRLRQVAPNLAGRGVRVDLRRAGAWWETPHPHRTPTQTGGQSSVTTVTSVTPPGHQAEIRVTMHRAVTPRIVTRARYRHPRWRKIPWIGAEIHPAVTRVTLVTMNCRPNRLGPRIAASSGHASIAAFPSLLISLGSTAQPMVAGRVETKRKAVPRGATSPLAQRRPRVWTRCRRSLGRHDGGHGVSASVDVDVLALLAALDAGGPVLMADGGEVRGQTTPEVRIGSCVARMTATKPARRQMLRQMLRPRALQDEAAVLDRGWTWLEAHPDHPKHDDFEERWIERLRQYERTDRQVCGEEGARARGGMRLIHREQRGTPSSPASPSSPSASPCGYSGDDDMGGDDAYRHPGDSSSPDRIQESLKWCGNPASGDDGDAGDAVMPECSAPAADGALQAGAVGDDRWRA